MILVDRLENYAKLLSPSQWPRREATFYGLDNLINAVFYGVRMIVINNFLVFLD